MKKITVCSLLLCASTASCVDENRIGDEPSGPSEGSGGYPSGELPEGDLPLTLGRDKPSLPDPTSLAKPSLIDDPVETVDLLFVVDNSVGVADQQRLLADAVGALMNDLSLPPCIADGARRARNDEGQCPAGSEPLFSGPIDVHAGVITSSLGGRGSATCHRDDPSGDYDDQGHLLPFVRPDLPAWADPDGTGFVSWRSDSGEPEDALVDPLLEQIRHVGQQGCGFESQMEAWYRFLVDPSPPASVAIDGSQSVAFGVDEELLAERRAFLRPGGVVAVVVLTDEDDCSALSGGDYYPNAAYGYLTMDPAFQMAVSTEVCADDPNDKCCFSCLQAPPKGCEAEAQVCSTYEKLPPEADAANVRCFDQKRRFGIDLLYPTERYVAGLTQARIIDARYGSPVYNPLMVDPEDTTRSRDPARVFFSGIVGVPWQNLATEQSLNSDDTLEYLDASELSRASVDTGDGMVSRWDLMVGEPGLPESSLPCLYGDDPRCGAAVVPPLDPFMVSSIGPRPSGTRHPLTGDRIVPVGSEDPLANAINGHEFDTSVAEPAGSGLVNNQLQYACLYPLPTPVNCDGDEPCECADEPSRDRPTCQPPEGGPVTTTQYFEGATPAPRILQVMKDLGPQALPASVCPKTQLDATLDPQHGYNPALLKLGWQIGQTIRSSGN